MSTVALLLYSPGNRPARCDGVITIGSTLWNGLLVGLSLAAGAVFVVRASAGSPDRTACGAHALMGLAMAGMFWPGGDPVPAVAGAVAFAVLGVWFAVTWLRRGSRRVDGPAHVAVGSVAMVLMYLTHTGGAHVGHADHAGHAVHGGGVATGGGAGALLAAAGLLLTGYFLWHAWESIPHVTAARVPEPAGRHRVVGSHGAAVASPTRALVVERLEPAAHVAMSLLMAVMFLGTI